MLGSPLSFAQGDGARSKKPAVTAVGSRPPPPLCAKSEARIIPQNVLTLTLAFSPKPSHPAFRGCKTHLRVSLKKKKQKHPLSQGEFCASEKHAE